MKILAAPIIHARNTKHDFPSRLFVIPDDFSDSDIQWTRSYILDSTKCMEWSGQEGRRIAFCNDKVVVIGISVFIEYLYSACEKTTKYDDVDGNRNNYAFIGFVIPKTGIEKAFDVPLSILLEEYEKYMDLRWEEESSNGYLDPLQEEYSSIDFPDADDSCNTPIPELWHKNRVLDVHEVPLENILAIVTFEMRQSDCIAFCSNIPDASSIISGKFTLATSKNADSILEAMRNWELEEAKEKELEELEENQAKEKKKKPLEHLVKIVKKKEEESDKKETKNNEQGKTTIGKFLNAHNSTETAKMGKASATKRLKVGLELTIERTDS